MSEQEKISALVRIVSGVTGILGFAAIAFNATQNDGLQLNFMSVASFFAGFVFLYVSIFGEYPWNRSQANDADE